MPTYEYLCRGCGKKFEKFQKISEAPLTECKDCGGRIERLISETSFALRGSGWFKNGYSSKKPEKAAEKVEKKTEKKVEKKENKANDQ